MEEYEKILIAYDYFESDRFLVNSDEKAREHIDRQKRLNHEIQVKRDELEVMKRNI